MRSADEMKVTEEIFQVGGESFSSSRDAAVYLVRFGEHAALIDAGCGDTTPRILENVQACGVEPGDVKLLLLTHCHYDHTGGAEALRTATGCTVVVHEKDAPYLEKGDNVVTAARYYGEEMAPVSADRLLTLPREQIDLGDRFLEALHTPGHSPGSVVYLTESQGHRVLFAQDVHGPLTPKLLSDRGLYRESLQLMLSLEADILCEGHYGVFRGRGEVERFIRSFLEKKRRTPWS